MYIVNTLMDKFHVATTCLIPVLLHQCPLMEPHPLHKSQLFNSVFFNLYFEKEPLQQFRLFTEPHAMIHVSVVSQKEKKTAVTSNAFANECHDHNDYTICSLKRRLYSSELVLGDFRCSFNFFARQWWSGMPFLACHWWNC